MPPNVAAVVTVPKLVRVSVSMTEIASLLALTTRDAADISRSPLRQVTTMSARPSGYRLPKEWTHTRTLGFQMIEFQ